MTNRLFKIILEVEFPPWRKPCLGKAYVFVLLTLLLSLLCSCSAVDSLFSPSEEIEYSVRSGDSLYLIAQRFDVSLLELQKRNRISDARKLQVGQVLKVPVRSDPNRKPYGGPYVSAEQARKQRANVTFPALSSLNVSMIMPLERAKIGSPFGYRGSRFHEGIDLVAAEGTPIYAAHDGLVIFSGRRLSGYGNMVALQRGQILTVYAHTSLNLVERGQVVSRGTKIAVVGATGRATGPHLHFEVRVRGNDNRYYAVEPMDFLKIKS